MAKQQPVFFYYEQFGEACAGKTIVDDGVWLGGDPSPLVTVPLTAHEYELTLDQLRRLYPYNG